MAGTYSNLLSHIVFSTKNRKQLITTELKAQLHPYLGGIVRKIRGVPLAIGGPEDHVHMLCRFSPALALAELIKKVKANSSKWVSEQALIANPFSWQRGYAAFSVSRSMADKVALYIEKQEQQHRKIGFREELVEMMVKHGITYDGRFLLD